MTRASCAERPTYVPLYTIVGFKSSLLERYLSSGGTVISGHWHAAKRTECVWGDKAQAHPGTVLKAQDPEEEGLAGRHSGARGALRVQDGLSGV